MPAGGIIDVRVARPLTGHRLGQVDTAGLRDVGMPDVPAHAAVCITFWARAPTRGRVLWAGARDIRTSLGRSDRHRPVWACGGAAGRCTVTRSPPSARGLTVSVPSWAWVMLLTIASPRPTPAW